jgi:general secretion pathway protein M
MKQIEQLKHWFEALTTKEQRMLIASAGIILITLFYLLVWEPIHLELDSEIQKKKSQTENMIWMQEAASEVLKLRSAGNRSVIRDANKPATLVIEQSINNAGLKDSVTKIESSGKSGARVTLNEVSFNQMLVWMNTLATHNGIHIVSANIERASKQGRANARLTFERP